jgi:ribose-phosphate pyrophosphokinase
MAAFNSNKYFLVAGTGCFDFVQNINFGLEFPIGYCPDAKFANGELRIEILVPDGHRIRGKHIYLFASGSKVGDFNVNDLLIQTFGLLDACQRSDVKSITLFWLLFPYARDDKKVKSRTPIMSSRILKFLETYEKLSRIVTVDLHSGQIQGMTVKPLDNLFGNVCFREAIIKEFQDGLLKDQQLVLVSPDGGSIPRTKDYLRDLHEYPVEPLFLSKSRSTTKMNQVDSIRLTDYDRSILAGKYILIIDDMIDTAGTIVKVIESLNDSHHSSDESTKRIQGAIIVATHGILSDPAIDRLENCNLIKKVFISDSVTQTRFSWKIEIVSLTDLISKNIKKLINHESLSDLYQ